MRQHCRWQAPLASLLLGALVQPSLELEVQSLPVGQEQAVVFGRQVRNVVHYAQGTHVLVGRDFALDSEYKLELIQEILASKEIVNALFGYGSFTIENINSLKKS